jgi:hypothetical protein
MTTMNKIRSIKQLKAEQRKLEQRKNELEKAIHYDWRDLKETIKPRNVAGKVFAHFFEREKESRESPLANTLAQVVALLTKVGVAKAEEKLADWVTRRR